MSLNYYKYYETIFDFFELGFYSADRGNRTNRPSAVRPSVGSAVGVTRAIDVPPSVPSPSRSPTPCPSHRECSWSCAYCAATLIMGHDYRKCTFLWFSLPAVSPLGVGPGNATGSRGHFTCPVGAAGSMGLLSDVVPLDCGVVWAQVDEVRRWGDGRRAYGVRCRFLTRGATLCHRPCLFAPASIA